MNRNALWNRNKIDRTKIIRKVSFESCSQSIFCFATTFNFFGLKNIIFLNINFIWAIFQKPYIIVNTLLLSKSTPAGRARGYFAKENMNSSLLQHCNKKECNFSCTKRACRRMAFTFYWSLTIAAASTTATGLLQKLQVSQQQQHLLSGRFWTRGCAIRGSFDVRTAQVILAFRRVFVGDLSPTSIRFGSRGHTLQITRHFQGINFSIDKIEISLHTANFHSFFSLKNSKTKNKML